MIRFFVVTLTFLVGAVFAQPTVTCTTQSNGNEFTEQAFSPDAASMRVVESCSRNPFTNYDDCRSLVDCYYENVYNQFTICNTRSAGNSFDAKALNPSVAKDRAIEKCSNNPFTSYSDCQRLVDCYLENGGYNPPPYPQPMPQPMPPVDDLNDTITVNSNFEPGRNLDMWLKEGKIRDITIWWNDNVGKTHNALASVYLDEILLGTEDIKKDGGVSKFFPRTPYSKGHLVIEVQNDQLHLDSISVNYYERPHHNGPHSQPMPQPYPQPQPYPYPQPQPHPQPYPQPQPYPYPQPHPQPMPQGCNPQTQPAPDWGMKNGVCLQSCGKLVGDGMGAALLPASCSKYQMLDAGQSWEVGFCCKPVCNPKTQPTPDWGVKNMQCLKSCGQLGGTASFDDSCSKHGMTEVGKAYDRNFCCR